MSKLWVKRDDLSGFSWGGNKVRAAEFLVGDAVAKGANEVIVAGGPSSNFVALMAVAASAAGLGVHQVSFGDGSGEMPSAMAVSRAVGAQVTFTGSADRALMESWAAELAIDRTRLGRVPYVVPRGGASAVGALGFLAAAFELEQQAEAIPDFPTRIVIALGSGGSTAGLIAGLCKSDRPWVLHAVSVSRAPQDVEGVIVDRAVSCAALAGVHIDSSDVLQRLRIHDGRAPGFGCESPEQARLSREVTINTGLIVDHTYNAKAIRWLRDANQSGLIDSEPFLYWHTGGALGAIDRLHH